MKYLFILALFVFLFNGCEKYQENEIQPTQELDLESSNQQNDDFIYKHYFRRVFIFDSHPKILRFQ